MVATLGAAEGRNAVGGFPHRPSLPLSEHKEGIFVKQLHSAASFLVCIPSLTR